MALIEPRTALRLAAVLLTLAAAPIASSPSLADSGKARERTQAATRILDRRSASRILANKGLTLQWIDWGRRGNARVSREGGRWALRGRQEQRNGPGRLAMDGTIEEIGTDYFVFRGKISITDTPDAGRSCSMDKTWRFAITRNRSYYRLREFEWCDDLTDYIDLYF